MASQSRKHRGYRSQAVVAEKVSRIFPAATSAGAGRPGADVVNTPGVAWEVKARRSFNPKEWAQQAARNAGDELPVVTMRPDGMGETSVGDWPTFVRLDDFLDLLERAGYGVSKNGRPA